MDEYKIRGKLVQVKNRQTITIPKQFLLKNDIRNGDEILIEYLGNITSNSLKMRCNNCNKEFVQEEDIKYCPLCKSYDITVFNIKDFVKKENKEIYHDKLLCYLKENNIIWFSVNDVVNWLNISLNKARYSVRYLLINNVIGRTYGYRNSKYKLNNSIKEEKQ